MTTISIGNSSNNHYSTDASHGIPCHHLYQALSWDQYGSDAQTMRRVYSDAQNRMQFPSWSWVGWSGHVRYPLDHYQSGRTNLVIHVIDAANLVASSPNEPCQPLAPEMRVQPHGLTTIHIEQAWVLDVRLDSLPNGHESQHQVFHMRSEHRHFPEPWTVGFVRADPDHVRDQDPHHVYELLALTSAERGDFSAAILTDVVDGFSVRMGHWHHIFHEQGNFRVYCEENARSRYVRLR